MESSATPEPPQQRELEVAREIAQAFLTAPRPLEVYRLALARVLPLVGASFASVFLREDDDPELLRLICAHNWPQSSARYLGQLRIRVGRGPTGSAVAERSAVWVEDLFADPSLREWWEPAHELGFASLISLPLVSAERTEGALSFYFEKPHAFSDGELSLLRLIAEQLSATAQRAHHIDRLERANTELEQRVRQMEEDLRDAEEARRVKDEFLANMSHELRTPLTAILGYADLLRAGHGGPLADEQAGLVAKIERSGTALQRLITDLLELSQLKLGRTAVLNETTEAVELAERAIADGDEPPEGVTVSLQTPDGRIPLTTDPRKVGRILSNLVSNALKFTRSGEIRVTVRQQQGFGMRAAGPGAPAAAVIGSNGSAPRVIEWVVQDSGIGIEPGDLDAIFDEFRQVDGSSTRLYGGTGLGLALSLRLARLLHGEILVQSEPDVGSTFTLRLPVRPPGEHPAARSSAAKSAAAASAQRAPDAARATAEADELARDEAPPSAGPAPSRDAEPREDSASDPE